MTVSKTDVTVCPKCGGKNVRQDEDVLDTWFSSALWPFSTLGYPEMTEDLKYFYPTDVLVTAYDIIFFWVARMIFSGVEHMNRIPFKDVLIHGLVRDAQGRKMSKSLGNGIDPLEIIDEYGADTLRYALLNGIAPGSDTRFSKEKLEGCRNYVNKIWNASRFVIMNAENREIKDIKDVKLSISDKWIISKLNATVRKVTVNMEKYEIGLAAGELQDFVWNDFCDWYIELSKPALYGDDEDKKDSTVATLIYVLKNTLKLLHPFIPFVTEEIYQHIPGVEGSIMVSEYPRYNSRLAHRKDAESMVYVMGLIKAIRQIRADAKCAPSKKLDVYIVTERKPLIEKASKFILKLANVSEIKFVEQKDEITEKTVSQILDKTALYVPLGELVDIEKEAERLDGELKRVEGEIKRANGKLANQGFLAKAPKVLVDGEKEKLNKYLEMREKVLNAIRELKN